MTTSPQCGSRGEPGKQKQKAIVGNDRHPGVDGGIDPIGASLALRGPLEWARSSAAVARVTPESSHSSPYRASKGGATDQAFPPKLTCASKTWVSLIINPSSPSLSTPRPQETLDL